MFIIISIEDVPIISMISQSSATPAWHRGCAVINKHHSQSQPLCLSSFQNHYLAKMSFTSGLPNSVLRVFKLQLIKGNGYEGWQTSLFDFFVSIFNLDRSKTTIDFEVCWSNWPIETFLLRHLAVVWIVHGRSPSSINCSTIGIAI